MTTLEAPNSFETYTEERNYIFQRFSNHVDAERLQNIHLTLVGCGNVGSFQALAAAKMGVGHLTLVDFDIVERHNVGNQIFGMPYCGQYKVSVLASLLRQTSVLESITEVAAEYEPTQILNSDVVISATDSMEVRKSMFEDAVMIGKARLFIDYRTGNGQCYMRSFSVTDRESVERYRASLFPSSEAAPIGCNDVGGVGSPLLAAAFLTTALQRYSLNLPVTSAYASCVKDLFQVIPQLPFPERNP